VNASGLRPTPDLRGSRQPITDRLTRSPFDLVSVLLPLFEAHRVQLVDVAQHIDTSTANGRLSLNLLVSFVEFEREAIGERTRDKLAATLQRGLWQGHGTPLGYTVDFEQRVVVVDKEVVVPELFIPSHEQPV
jgi:site-specific DNA recombinase